MTRIHDNGVNNIAECNLLHYIINHPNCSKNQISINLLLYMHVCILERVKRSLRALESYRILDVLMRRQI